MNTINSELYERLLTIRKVEEKIIEVYPTDKIKSPVHLSIGQEYIALATCYFLVEKDAVFGTYRSHALYLAKGGSLNQMIYELFGKNKSYSKGKAGSMHLCDPKNGVIFNSAIVSSTIPLAAGYAFSNKLKKNKKIVLSFFGDGATEEGVFFETLNFSALKKLPIIFICENNSYAINTRIENRQANINILSKPKSFNIETYKFNSNDILKILPKMKILIDNVRKNPRPIFIEFKTDRLYEHVGIGFDNNYTNRSIKTLEKIKKNDSLSKLEKKIPNKSKSKILNRVTNKINFIFNKADKDKFPAKTELKKDLY